jgi:hypothetical protein
MDELRDIDFSDILNEFNDNTAQVQNRQASRLDCLLVFDPFSFYPRYLYADT